MDDKIISNVLSLSFGIFLIIFRNQWAKTGINMQNDLWGYKFGDREIKISKIIISLVAILFILTGLIPLVRLLIN